MDHLQRLIRRGQTELLAVLFLNNALLIGAWWVTQAFNLNHWLDLAILVVIALVEMLLISSLIVPRFMQPVKALWQAILHLSPQTSGIEAPQIDKLKFGKELVSHLTLHIYQLVSVADKVKGENTALEKDLKNNFVAQNLPLPLLVLDAQETIKFANQATADYIGMKIEDLIGKNVYMILNMSFTSNDTFDNWLKKVKVSSATAVQAWERVKIDVRDNHPTLLFDMAAYYNRDNLDHNETMIVLFDHTKQYSQDDQAVSFVALSVHELRTPLTLLRGYIEVFEEELDGQLNDELKGFMDKMHAQAEQLMAFVNNILNVARVDDDQLELKLQEGDWPSTLQATIESLSLRAKVRGITLNCSIAEDLPKVAIDRLSVQEVINNLVDNAIKYSGKSTVINIASRLTKDGLVETTVEDHGLGISSSIMANLFTKFYRDHHNRSQVGGTGLGLYLSNAIIQAHGGNLWVRSTEGKGSTFGFTLVPYAQLNEEVKRGQNQEIVRGAHGWIKNHSLYRR